MLLGKYLKTPEEMKRYSIEYEDWLDVDEYLAIVVFAVISPESGTLKISKSPLDVDATRVVFFFSEGVSGETYTVSVTATTTTGQIKQDTITVSVRAL